MRGPQGLRLAEVQHIQDRTAKDHHYRIDVYTYMHTIAYVYLYLGLLYVYVGMCLDTYTAPWVAQNSVPEKMMISVSK